MNERRSHLLPLSALLSLLAVPVGWALLAQTPPDTTPPQISILESGAALVEGRLFNRAASPVIQATDTSAVTVDATLDGAAFTSGTSVSGEGTHLLSVTATDAAGNAATLAVGFEIDTTAPAFVSLQPADAAIVAAAQVTLTGQVTGASSVKVDGQAVTLVGQDFTAGPYTLAEGARSFAIVAADPAGNTAQRTLHVTRDSQAPTISISQPATGALLKDGSVDVVGSAQDPHLAAVTVNGTTATLTGTTWLARQVPLAEGSNTLTARAEDQAGNAAQATRAVERDSTPPTLVITDPAPGTIVPGASITLRGTAADAHLDRVEINGVRATLAGGTWSLVMSLHDGSNDFTVRAFDKVSNAGDATLSVTRDSDAPAVHINQPVDGARLNAQTLAVSGTVDQEAGLTLTVNGVAATITGGTFSAAAVPLVEGNNTLIARVTDSVGNQGTHTRVVVRDTVAPKLDSADPVSGALALPVDAIFRLSFSEDIAEPAAGSWRLETGAGQAIPATANRAGSVLTVRPSVPLPSSAQVRLVLTAAIADLAGNALAQPPTLTFLTVDTTAPSAPVFDPAPPQAICAASILLTGTAEAGAVVRVEGAAAAGEARADETGHFSLSIQLSPGGLNRLQVTATDSGGNVSAPALAAVVHDCQAPRVLSADRQGNVFHVVFSEPVVPASLAGAVQLSYASGAIAGTVSLATNGLTATFTPTGSLPAGTLRLEVTTAVKDLAGNAMAYPWSQVFGAQGGSGFLLGTVIDNATGRPLAGARVLVTATNGTALAEPLPEQVTGEDGRFRLPVPAGTHDLTIVRPGYAPAFRLVTSGAGQGTEIFDPRLTPAAKAATLGSGGGTWGSGGDAILTLPGGALAESVAVAVTRLDEQGLPMLLPYGWSPRGAVWLDLGSAALLADSTLSLPVESANGTTLVLIHLDLSSLQWRVLGTAQVAGGRVTFTLPAAAAGLTDGGWAAVQADSGAFAPPAPVTGAVLGGSARPAGNEATAATLTFNPEVVLPSQSSQATALYTVSQGVASGLPVTLSIVEQLTLLDNSVRNQTPYQADLVLYHAADGTARSRFQLRPSLAAQALPLKLGAEDVTLRTYGGEAVAGNVVGAEGGTVTGDQGDRIDLPPGAVTEPTAVVLTRKTAADLGLAAPAGTELAGVVDLDLGGKSLLVPAALSLALSPAPAAGDKGLLLQVIDLESGKAFRAVAALQATASGWTTSAIDPTDLAWPGVREEGLYAFVRLTAPAGYLRGTVFDVGGAPLAGAVVRGTGVGWLQISNANGTYVLPAPVTTLTATAENRVTGNQGSAAATVPAADARVDVDITLLAVGPHVVAITPADGAVDVTQGIQPTIRFSEPVNPALGAGAIQLLSDGQPVAIDLDVQGILVRVKPRATLLPATAYELRVTSGVHDLQGNPLESPVASTFTTLRLLFSKDVDLTRIFLVAPDATGQARVLGRAGAVPSHATVFVENRNALVTTPTVTAGQDGSFDMTIQAALTHTLILHVLIPNSNEIVARLTPFRTPDLKGAYVDDKAVTFTTGEGLTAAIPAGAFSGPTIVSVAARPVAQSPVLARDAFTAVASFTLDFSGAEAHKALTISLPLPAGAPTPVGGFYLLNRVVEALGDHFWMMHDLMRLDAASGRLTTEEVSTGAAATTAGASVAAVVASLDAPFTLAAASSPRVVSAASIVPHHKQYVPGAAFPGQYQIEAPLIPLGFTIFPAFDMNSQVGIWNLGLEGIFTSMNGAIARLLEQDGVLIPTRLDRPSRFVVRDLGTGFKLYDATLPPPTPETPVTLPPDVYGDKTPPYPVGGTPIRFFPVDVVVDGRQDLDRGIYAEVASGRVTIKGEAGSAGDAVHVRLIGLDDDSHESAVTNADGSFTLTHSPGHDAKRFLLAIGAKVPDYQAFEVSFSEALDPDFTGIEILDSRGKKTEPAKRPVGSQAVLRLEPKAGWKAKEVYTLRLGPEMRDAIGNVWGKSLEIEFEVAARAPISTYPLASARDVARLGSLLFVAGDTTGLVVLDASDPSNLRANGTYPFPLADAVTAVAVDPHGRVLAAGGGVRAQGQLKIFDPLTMSFKGSTILSDVLGGPGTQLPAGIPQRIAILSQDQTSEWVAGKPAPQGLTLVPPAVPVNGDGEEVDEYTLVVSGTGTAKLPVTLQNVTAGRWARVDAAATGGAFQVSLSVRPGDQLRLLRNTKTYAYVLTRGVGVEVVDVDAFYNESDNRVLSDVVGIYSGFQDPQLRLCGEAVADLSTSVSDFAPLFDENNLNPLTLVGLVGFRGLVLLRSDPASVGNVSFLNEACADVAGSRNVSGLLVLQSYAFDLNNDGRFTADERRDYILVSHQQAGVLIYDATDRQNLVLAGRIRLPGTASRLGVDRDSHRLFVSGLSAGFYVVDLSRKPSVDLIDANGDGIDDRVLETVALTGNTNVAVRLVPELGLAYVGGSGRGLTSVAVGHPEIQILARDPEGHERQVERLAPFGIPTTPESSDPQAKNLPGSIRILASLPGFSGNEAHLDVIAEDMGGFPIPEAGDPDVTEGLPRASWKGDHSMVLHRLAEHPWEPGYERYSTKDIALVTDLRASAGYKRTQEENDACVRCDQTQEQEKVAKDAHQLLSGDYIRIAFSQSLRDQLAPIYDRERLDSAEKRLTSVRWELSPAPKQETERNPALTQAPGVLGHSGEITLSAVDLSIPGRGLDFVFQRTYRSQTVGSGTLGPGWDSNVYERLQELPTGDVAHFDGRGRRDQFKKEQNGDLTAPPGVFSTLEKVSTGWVLIDARHTTTRFDRFGRLISIADPVKDSKDTGNEMTFHYGPGRQLLRVHDTLDRDIRFEYDDKQRLKKIKDFTDREFTFEYDPAGRLVKALTPSVVSVLAPDEVLVTQNGPLTTEYVYDQATGNLTKALGARDNIKSVKDSKNQTWLQVNYANAGDDKAPQKVESEVWGGGSVGLQYSDNAATETDALGHSLAYTFSPKGQITGIKDPANAEVHYTYDDEGLVTSRTDPLGKVTQYFYDSPCIGGDPIGKRRSRGNLTHVIVTAGANGANGPSNTVETCTDYEPYSNQPVKVVDPRGIITQISRTEVGLPERIEQGSGTPDFSVTETHYNEFGQPILMFNPNHHTTAYQYSNSDPSTGYLEKITVDQGGLNLVTRFETDARGNVTRMIDPRGVGFTRVYNDLDWIIESHRASTSAVPDAPALNYVTTYFYDPNGNLSEMRLPYGDDGSTFTRVQSVYGSRNELLATARQVKPGDHAADWVKEYFFYDDALNLIKKIEPEGQTTRYVYDQRNQLSAMVQGYDTPDAVTLGFGYNADGQRIAFSDGRQSIWTTAYDGFGRVKETRDPLGNRATVLYDNGSNPVETSVYQPPVIATDPPTLLARRSAEYDPLNRVRSITAKLWTYDPLTPGLPNSAVSLVTQKSYDPASNFLSVTDPLGRVSRMEYDHAERPVASVDAAGNRTEHDLDATGHPLVTRSIEQRPAGGAVTVTVQSSYDALGRLASTTDGLGNTQRHTYDARNNLRLSIDAEGNVTERSYDGLDRLTRHVQPEGISVDFGYDKSSRLLSYRDALNQETDYTYDVLNRRKSVLYPSASIARPQELYTYDANGNLKQTTDPNGTVVTQTFDAANRLTGRAVGPASGILGPTAESFIYDGVGRMTHAQSANVATDITFDSLSRVTNERNAGRDLGFDYDGVGNALRVQYPSGFAVGKTFDGLNRPLSIGRANGAEAVSYGYRGASLVASKSLFNGLVGNRDYDAARRLLDETFRLASGQTVFRESLAWTPRSLKAGQSRGDLEKRGLIFAYDGAERLMQAGKSPDPLALVTNNHVVDPSAFNNLPDAFSYNYDKAQNLLARTEKKNGVPAAVDLPLDGSMRNHPASVGGVALEWDANGNLTRKGDLHFQYDYRNRLTRVTRGTSEEVATYQYDAFNRRIKKTVGSENRETVWRGWQPVEEYKNGGLDQRRVYGLGLDEIVQLQVDLDGNGDPEQAYAPLYDSTGSLAEVTGNNGKPIERYEYTPYGQRKIFVDSTPPAVEQVRVKGNALVVELSEGISSDALAKVLTANTLTLTNLATQQPIGIAVTQPVLTGREARRRLLITTTGPPAAETQVRLTIPAAALQDSFLNQPAQDFQLTFAWPAGDAVVQDNKPIQLQRVSVRDGFLEIELSEEPNLATTSAIQIDGATTTWALGDDRYTLKSANLLASGSHALAIGTTLGDLNGGTLAQAFNANVSVTPHENLAVFEVPDSRETAASTIGNLIGFQGLSIDSETGLIYVRNRYYDPELGRFITADPKGYVDGPSLYAFEIDDPANGSDPLGLCKGFLNCLKEGAKETAGDGLEFVAGVGQGLAGSINPNAYDSQPSDSDTKSRRVGQYVGSALAFAGGGDVATTGVVIAVPSCIVTVLAVETGPVDAVPAAACVGGGVIAYAGAKVSVNAVGYAMKLHDKGTSSGERAEPREEPSGEKAKPNEEPNPKKPSADPAEKNGWKLDPKKDLDWRGSGKTQQEAVDEAFKRTGVPKDQFQPTEWARDANGKSFPVEWRAKGGAEVSIDTGHANNGPGVPHVGYQTPGKPKSVGHILLDGVSVNRN